MALADLPYELLAAIVAAALAAHAQPSAVLGVNHAFLALGRAALHAHLHFRTARQLAAFAAGVAPLACVPRSLALRLAGADADFGTFDRLLAALARCKLLQVDGECAKAEAGVPPLALENLDFCLHSHTRNPRLHVINDALTMVDPVSFSWTGPDPAHHFSTAIVPEAAHHLLNAISRWSHLRHLHLTNLSLGEPPHASALPPSTPSPVFLQDAPLLAAPLPALESFYIGQATFVPPRAVAATLALPGMPALVRVRLVDVYEGSIWGRRMRRSCVERAAEALSTACDTSPSLACSYMGRHAHDGRGEHVEDAHGERRAALLERIRHVVVCEAQTERFEGGDRAAEGTTELL